MLPRNGETRPLPENARRGPRPGASAAQPTAPPETERSRNPCKRAGRIAGTARSTCAAGPSDWWVFDVDRKVGRRWGTNGQGRSMPVAREATGRVARGEVGRDSAGRARRGRLRPLGQIQSAIGRGAIAGLPPTQRNKWATGHEQPA
jgi:hypothetical protein